MSLERLNCRSRTGSWIIWLLPIFLAACLGDNEPPFPGQPPQRAVAGTPPPTVNPQAWFGDVKHWGAETYVYYSPHLQGNRYRQQAGVSTSYDGSNLRQIPFLSGIDPGFAPYEDAGEASYQEELALEAYRACVDQGLEFYYAIPFPIFPVQLDSIVQKVHPEWFGEDGQLNYAHPELIRTLPTVLNKLKTAMPEMRGICLLLNEDNDGGLSLSAENLEKASDWLEPLLAILDETGKGLSLRTMVTAESIWHSHRTRQQTYQLFNKFPEVTIMLPATWPEETTRMPYRGFVPAADTSLLEGNPVAVSILTDTEFLGRGEIPVVLPRWWQYLAQQAYLHKTDLAIARSFQGDEGGSATNFNRLNIQLMLEFLQDPRLSLKPTLHSVNEKMFGDDFPSRLTSIMIIAEDAIQAITSVNYINFLEEGQFPSPRFLDRDYLAAPHRMKGIDDLFEPPGTPLYPEETERPDTLQSYLLWRWQMEVTARPVDEYLLSIENAITWLEKIQKEVEYLTLDFSPQHREMFVGGYRDLLLLGRGAYQFVQGAAVHHRWYRLQRITKTEALEQLAPIAEQIRLIADEADGSSLELKDRLLTMAEAFETLNIPPRSH